MPHPASSYAWGIKKCNTFVALFNGVGASRFKLRFEWLRGKLSSVVGSRALAKNLELLQGLEAGDTSMRHASNDAALPLRTPTQCLGLFTK